MASLKFLFYYLVVNYRSRFLIQQVPHCLKDKVYVLEEVYFRLLIIFNVKIFFLDRLNVEQDKLDL